jgi:hypothetical protein
MTFFERCEEPVIRVGTEAGGSIAEGKLSGVTCRVEVVIEAETGGNLGLTDLMLLRQFFYQALPGGGRGLLMVVKGFKKGVVNSTTREQFADIG